LLYSVVLFDHDGTLLESGPGILAVARAVLRDMNLPDQPDETMVKMLQRYSERTIRTPFRSRG
jgi:phosphoglycolate phosphatase-like HAD superfamily hydrolase